MKKTFTLRVDLESDKGIRYGLPRLLDLLKKYGIKASFYLVMGGESNLLEILRYRGGMTSSDERKIKVWSLRDKARMALIPKDFVVGNLNILRRIINEGHELGIHGWKHREWTRGLDSVDIKRTLNKAIIRYRRLFGRNPISFASPGFNINEPVLKALKEKGIEFISDFEGDKPRYYHGIKNVPITICGEKRTPIIEYLVSKGKRDKEIVNFIDDRINKKSLASFYIHGLFEARFKLGILEEVFRFIIQNKIKNKRIIDL